MDCMNTRTITVVGAGITGLWQALTLARRGHRVRLVERSAEPFARRRQRAMPAPCWRPTARRRRPSRSCASWGSSRWRSGARPIRASSPTARWWSPARATAPSSTRFARMTEGFDKLDAVELARARARSRGPLRRRPLLRRGSAHGAARGHARSCSTEARARRRRDVASAPLAGGVRTTPMIVIDCRGLAARGELAGLRGVRGERLIVRTARGRPEAPGAAAASAPPALRRAVGRRPLHGRRHRDRERRRGPRDGALGARAAGQRLCAASGVRARPQIVDMGAGVRPAFADNVPEDRRARPHHPRQRPLPPRLPAGARARRAGGRLSGHRRRSTTGCSASKAEQRPTG